MATKIIANGVSTSKPGSYSKVDASGLNVVGLGANGIIAVLGTGEGGIPVSAITKKSDILQFTRPEAMRKAFRSGDLKEVADMLFTPSNDDDITSGAAVVVPMKINNATAAQADLSNAQGVALTLKARDFGAFTSQINAAIASGTVQGKLVTLKFEDTTETVDNLGGDTIFSLQYIPGATGWATMAATITAAGISCTGTRAQVGGSNLITTQLAANGLVEVLSSSASDNTQKVTVFGLGATGLPQKEVVSLNGTTVVTTTQQFNKVYGVQTVGTTTVGVVTVRAAVAGAVVFDLPAATMAEGLILCDYTYVDNDVVTFAGSGATTSDIVIVGKSATGADQMEKLVLTGTTPVLSLSTWSRIDYVAVGAVSNSVTLTMTGRAAFARVTTQKTVQKAVDYFNARQAIIAGPLTRGFAAIMVTGQVTKALKDLDYTVSATSILTAQNLKADIMAVADYLNQSSVLVSATRGVATGGAPDNTVSPVFLAGGGEGTATFGQWQAALDWLKQLRINTIVPLTGDPAVHAAVEAHCAFMCGKGKSERDCIVGAQNAGMTDVPSKTEYKAQAKALNARHTRVLGEYIQRYNTDGVLTEFPSYFYAAIAAGMQAGAPVGTSLTFKYPSILALRRHSTWNPVDNADEMIDAGCLFSEETDAGIRFVRNVTTYLLDSNPAFTEGGVNAAINAAVYNFRTEMEAAVGKRGFSGTVNGAKGIALGVLGLLVDNIIITSYQALSVVLVGDVLVVSVQMAPVQSINFVDSTIYLSRTTIAAA